MIITLQVFFVKVILFYDAMYKVLRTIRSHTQKSYKWLPVDNDLLEQGRQQGKALTIRA